MAHRDPRVDGAIKLFESKLIQLKYTMEALLGSLDLQEQVLWPDMITQYSSIASEFSALQAALKKSANPTNADDNGNLLKSHLIVPQRVALEPDTDLQTMTEGRLVSWNHEVLPISLRTKNTLDVEEDEKKLDNDRASRQSDIISKQISALNKHIESLCSRLTVPETANRQQPMEKQTRDSPAYSAQDTITMVKAITKGIGISKTNLI